MITLYDFTKCKIDLTANYGGSDKKRGIILYNKKYMLKHRSHSTELIN